MDDKVRIAFARFTYGDWEHPDVSDWVINAAMKAYMHPRVDSVAFWRRSDTPITMVRNDCLKRLREAGVDYVFMIDNDMKPDLPGEKPFFDNAFDFALNHQGPLIIGAPYCGQPPRESVHVARWEDHQNDADDYDFVIAGIPRREAVDKKGMERVAAMGTGLMLVDLKALDALGPPWFYYEYTDGWQTDKASTEDIVFTRNASLCGVPVYCAWDSWAGHWKPKLVTKPKPFPIDHFSEQLQQALLRKYGKEQGR